MSTYDQKTENLNDYQINDYESLSVTGIGCSFCVEPRGVTDTPGYGEAAFCYQMHASTSTGGRKTYLELQNNKK